MNSIAILVAMSAMGAAGDGSYAEAYAKIKKEDRALVVLVGADWCPGCVRMKATMCEPEVGEALSASAYAYVDAERELKLAKRLMRGSAIPQLVVYRRTKGVWKARRLTGARSKETVVEFLSEGAK